MEHQVEHLAVADAVDSRAYLRQVAGHGQRQRQHQRPATGGRKNKEEEEFEEKKKNKISSETHLQKKHS